MVSHAWENYRPRSTIAFWLFDDGFGRFNTLTICSSVTGVNVVLTSMTVLHTRTHNIKACCPNLHTSELIWSSCLSWPCSGIRHITQKSITDTTLYVTFNINLSVSTTFHDIALQSTTTRQASSTDQSFNTWHWQHWMHDFIYNTITAGDWHENFTTIVNRCMTRINKGEFSNGLRHQKVSPLSYNWLRLSQAEMKIRLFYKTRTFFLQDQDFCFKTKTIFDVLKAPGDQD